MCLLMFLWRDGHLELPTLPFCEGHSGFCFLTIDTRQWGALPPVWVSLAIGETDALLLCAGQNLHVLVLVGSWSVSLEGQWDSLKDLRQTSREL